MPYPCCVSGLIRTLCVVKNFCRDQESIQRSLTQSTPTSENVAEIGGSSSIMPMPLPGKFDEIFLTVFTQKTQIATLEKELTASRRDALVCTSQSRPLVMLLRWRSYILLFVIGQLDTHMEQLHVSRQLFEEYDDEDVKCVKSNHIRAST